MSESAQTPEENNEDTPAGDGGDSSAPTTGSKAGSPKSSTSSQSTSSQSSTAKPGAPKAEPSKGATAGGAKSESAHADSDDPNAGDLTDGGQGDAGSKGSGTPEPSSGDQTVSEADLDGTADQAATDEAFEAIVDGVEFDPVDGAAYGAVVKERDEYLAALQRLKAEFDNHRRRSNEQATAQREQAAASLVEKLLPVLDALDAADAHELEAVRPIRQQFLEALTASGLTRLHPDGESFDPEQHEAVMHEAGDNDEPQVAEVLRTGYAWNGRVLRPAMVKVRG